MPDEQGRLGTAISIVLRDQPKLEAIHRELHPIHAAAEIPLHVTVLFPFVPRDELSPAHEERLAILVSRHPPFSFALRGLARFPSVVYAVPSDDATLRALMRDVWSAFPETPPYGGAFADPPPHATLALIGDEDAAAVEERVRTRLDGSLPARVHVRDLSLMEEAEPDRWREARTLPLTGGR
jgi:2'-5' RNA ligase